VQALNLKQSPETILSEGADSLAMFACNTDRLFRPHTYSAFRGRRQHRVFHYGWQVTRRITGSWGFPSMAVRVTARKSDGNCDIARRGGLAVRPGNAGGVKPLPYSVSFPRKHRPYSVKENR
jgi:hypothetical protein